VLAEARAQYAIFIRDQLDKYFQQRQAAADYVADAAKKVADAVEGVIKGVADTALATVAALGVVLLAAATNEKLRGTFFTVTLALYAVYVFVQAAYRLLSASDSVRLLREEANTRLQAYTLRLSADVLDSLRESLKARWAQFARWRNATVLLYVILAAAVIALAILGPRATPLNPATNPTPMRVAPTSTSIPVPSAIPTVATP